MSFLQIDVLGSPNIGAYCKATDKICLIPFGLTAAKINQIRNTLHVPVIAISVGGSILNGILIAANSNGIALPYTINDEELKILKTIEDSPPHIIKSRYNALGNLILVNDNGAVVDPVFSNREVRELSDIFDVEIFRGVINNLPYVGSMAVATNNGVVAHPLIKEDEKKHVSTILKEDVEPATVNGGVPYPKLGIIANSQGLIVGSLTTGFEISEITGILKI